MFLQDANTLVENGNFEKAGDVHGAEGVTSSLTRDDTGAGACEVFYVTKVKVML